LLRLRLDRCVERCFKDACLILCNQKQLRAENALVPC